MSNSLHHVVVLALPNVIAFDLTIATEVFGRASHANQEPCYQLSVCSEEAQIDTGAFSMRFNHGLEQLALAQTIIVPGTEPASLKASPRVLAALRAAQTQGARIASICSGAFVLAQAGLLDGRRATTHWLAATRLAELYPQVQVDAAVLFVDEGQILTSAGAAAGIDLCLHMVRADFGASAAARVARLSVVPLQREGGQAQFIEVPDSSSNESLQPVMTWALSRLHHPLTLEMLANQARSSPRTLSRRFQHEVGTSPAQWLIRARVQRAQELLERSNMHIEQIVSNVGLGSAANFRAQFSRLVGVSPSQYRRNFGNRIVAG